MDGRKGDVGEEDGGELREDIAECHSGWGYLKAIEGSEEAGQDVYWGGEGKCYKGSPRGRERRAVGLEGGDSWGAVSLCFVPRTGRGLRMLRGLETREGLTLTSEVMVPKES